MSGFIRQINASDGSPITPPSSIAMSAGSWEVFANDAAYEAVHGAGTQGNSYFNSTELLLRLHNGTSWVYGQNGINRLEDSTSTGGDQDLDPTYHNLLVLTNAGLTGVRSMDPAKTTVVYLANQTGSDVILSNEAAGAVAGERLLLPDAASYTLADGNTAHFVYDAGYDSGNGIWRYSNAVGSGGGGGSGEGRVNLFPNGDFETGTVNWSSTKPAQITLETSTPLQGAQSLKITSDGAGQVVSTTLTVSADAYKGIQHGIEGVIDIPLTATTGDWVARFKRNGTTIANSETDLAPGRNRLQDLMAGFAPLLDTITFEIEDVSATASDVATCDIFVLTPQGQGNVREWPSYDESEVTVTATGLTQGSSYFRPYKDANGIIKLNFNFDFTHASFTNLTITVDGITFQSSGKQALSGASNISTGVHDVNTNAGVGTLSFVNNASGATEGYVSGDVVLDSWPTWATKGGNIQLLDNNGVYQNARARFYRNAAYSYTANTTFAFDQVSTLIDQAGITNTAGIFNFDSAGHYDLTFFSRSSSGNLGNIQIYKNGAFLSNIGAGNTTGEGGASVTFKIDSPATDTIELRMDAAYTVNVGDGDTWVEILKHPDSTGAQATGAGTSALANENPQNVLMNYQESGEGDLGTITGWASPGSKKYRWVKSGNKVDFYWYVTNTGGSSSSSLTDFAFALPSDVPSPENHLSNGASNLEYMVPACGATNSSNYNKTYVDYNSGAFDHHVALTASTALTYWTGHSSWLTSDKA